ncbi:MAG: cytidine deaminase [Salinivirgaceae bacterium]|nr:cytidine deaminase [Salinivirgaceae bacterium]
MIKKEYKTIVTEYSSETELSNQEQTLISKAKEAAKKAYAPYSKFNVGACVLLENGEFFSGNNQENAAYPSGLCAERVSMFYANSMHPDVAVISIAICASNENGFIKTPVPPCGSCRQVLLETEMRFKKSIKVIMVGSDSIHVIENVSQLLPLSFQKDNLYE